MEITSSQKRQAGQKIVLQSAYAQNNLGRSLNKLYIEVDDSPDLYDTNDFVNTNEMCQAQDVIWVGVKGEKWGSGGVFIRREDGTYREYDQRAQSTIGGRDTSASVIDFGGNREAYNEAQDKMFNFVGGGVLLIFIVSVAIFSYLYYFN